jgi:hypothetical protein
MRDDRIFGVNQRGDLRWLAWTCFAEDGRVVAGSFKELSVHDTEEQANEAANAARERHQSCQAI